MNLKTAKQIIHEEINTGSGSLAIAANVMALPKNDQETPLSDILLCLELGAKISKLNVVTEIAALTLYRRTGRKRKEGLPYDNLVTDPDDWRCYLTENAFID